MKKKIIIGSIVVVVALGLVYFIKGNKKEEIHYKAIPVERRTIDVTITATGTVQPKNRLEIKAPVAGRIEEVKIVEGKAVRKGQILAWMSSTERAAMLDAARSKGADEYKRWSELYLPTPILAPIDGTIILKSVEPGQTITVSDAIFVMSDQLSVKAQVDETDIAQVKNGYTAEIVLDAYPNDKVPAKVAKVAFDSKSTNNVTTYEVDVIPNEIPEYMRSGMTANVTFNVEARKDVLAIPAEALQIKNGKTIVLKKEGDKNVETEIMTGSTDGKFQEVTSGLSEGDQVMVQNYEIKEKSEKSLQIFGPRSPRKR